MENNNEKIMQNEVKKSKKGWSTSLVVIMLIVVLIIGIGGGYLLSKNDNLFNKNNTQLHNNESQNQNISNTDNGNNKDTFEIIDANLTAYATEYIDIIDEHQSKYPDKELICDLIYFNNDDIPDLVINCEGINLYMYENGIVHTLMENAAYEIGGSKYYNYLEKKGVIYNYGNGFAGAIRCDTYYVLNSKHKFDILSYLGKEEGIINSNLIPEETLEEIEKEIKKYGGYYYNEQKISEDEYNKKLKDFSGSINNKDYKMLEGKKTSTEIKEYLLTYIEQ